MTPDEAQEAIDGERAVSVFFADEVWARRMQRVSGKPSPLPLLPSEAGETWELVGDPERLPRGRYDVPMFAGKQQALVALALALSFGINPPRGVGFQLGIVVERKGVRYLLHQRDRVFATFPEIAAPIPTRTFPKSATLDVTREPPQPLKKIAAQGERILAALKALGLNPKSLPVRRGEDGPKQRAWIEVRRDGRLFLSERAFNKAWDHLRRAEEIQDVAPPRSRR